MVIQQGDVILESVSCIPNGKRITRSQSHFGRNRFILAEGEVTGHCHAIEDEVTMVESDKKVYLQTSGGEVLTHEQHGHITLPAGSWEVRIVEEYDHFAEEAKKVKD